LAERRFSLSYVIAFKNLTEDWHILIDWDDLMASKWIWDQRDIEWTIEYSWYHNCLGLFQNAPLFFTLFFFTLEVFFDRRQRVEIVFLGWKHGGSQPIDQSGARSGRRASTTLRLKLGRLKWFDLTRLTLFEPYFWDRPTVDVVQFVQNWVWANRYDQASSSLSKGVNLKSR